MYSLRSHLFFLVRRMSPSYFYLTVTEPFYYYWPLVLVHLRLQVKASLHPLQFCLLGVDDALMRMLRGEDHLLGLSSVVNTIQPLMLREKLQEMSVNTSTTSWITDCLTDSMWGCPVADLVMRCTGAPPGECAVSIPVHLAYLRRRCMYTGRGWEGSICWHPSMCAGKRWFSTS